MDRRVSIIIILIIISAPHTYISQIIQLLFAYRREKRDEEGDDAIHDEHPYLLYRTRYVRIDLTGMDLSFLFLAELLSTHCY